MTTGFRIIGCGLLLALLGVPAVRACDPVKPPKKIHVSVLIILASETDTEIHPKLICIAREVRKTHPKFTGFRLHKLCCQSLTVGTAEKLELVEGQKVCVKVKRVVLHGKEKIDRIYLKVGPPSMGEITYSTPCGKFLPILTTFRTKKGDVMLIAIRVQACNGK